MNNKQPVSGKMLLALVGSIALAALLVITVSGHYTNLPELVRASPIDEVFNAVKDSIISNPLGFRPIDWDVAKHWLTLSGTISGFGFLFVFTQTKEKRRVGAEHGSASWLHGREEKIFHKKFRTNLRKKVDLRIKHPVLDAEGLPVLDEQGNPTYKEVVKKVHPNEAGMGDRIVSQKFRITNNSQQTRINGHETVIGGSGTGKSRFYVKPNILEANGSYIVTDPAGELLASTGHFLKKEGYEIKVFNIIEMNKSSRYNPFMYIRGQEDVLKMINVFMKNTDEEGASKGDSFWRKSEQMLLMALVNYLRETAPPEEQNFSNLLELMKLEEVNEDDPEAVSQLGELMALLEEENPDSFAVENYNGFRTAAGKTLKSILITARARMAPFTSSPYIKDLLSRDEMDLGSVGDRKTALFIITPVADGTYNFLASMMYTQLFETLYYKSETMYNGQSLPIQVNFYLDEFANLGVIPDFTKIVATARKYGINIKIILQSLSQIKSLYKDDWAGIIGNCDTLIYLGGNEQETFKYMSDQLGKETISSRSSSRSYSKTDSRSASTQLLGRELMTSDEVGRMDNLKSLVMVRSQRPILDSKYDYPKHKNYKYTADADRKLNYVHTFPDREESEEGVENPGFIVNQLTAVEPRMTNPNSDLVEAVEVTDLFLQEFEKEAVKESLLIIGDERVDAEYLSKYHLSDKDLMKVLDEW